MPKVRQDMMQLSGRTFAAATVASATTKPCSSITKVSKSESLKVLLTSGIWLQNVVITMQLMYFFCPASTRV